MLLPYISLVRTGGHVPSGAGFYKDTDYRGWRHSTSGVGTVLLPRLALRAEEAGLLERLERLGWSGSSGR